MIKIYPIDVQIGNVENGISKLSNTKLQFWLSGHIIKYWMKCGIIGGMIGGEPNFLKSLKLHYGDECMIRTDNH